MIAFLTLLALAAWAWGASQANQVKQLKKQLKPIVDADRYAKLARNSADSLLSEARSEAEKALTEAKNEAQEIVNSAKTEKTRLEEYIRDLQEKTDLARKELEVINEGLRLKADDAHLLEVGYYEPVYGFEDINRFKKAIEAIKEKQKIMLRTGGETGDRSSAAYATEKMLFNNSETEGRKLLKKILQLLLRAFNGECDAFIARVNYRNITTMQKRMQSSYDQLNKISLLWNCQINKKYLANRLAELSLVYEYAELEQKIKEEQAYIREQERENEKIRREAERESAKARDAERRAEEIKKAVREVEEATKSASKKDQERLNQQIETLRQQLSEAQADLERAVIRAKSLAEQTKAGFVYVFSNVGSFGQNIYKIGMTRREDPEERRRELGDASVPFPFDCHAYIWTEDAPGLEYALHQHFSEKRLNLENLRKEFFNITIDEIKEEVERLKDKLGIKAEIRWTLLAEAKELRLSQAKRKHLESSLRKPDAQKGV